MATEHCNKVFGGQVPGTNDANRAAVFAGLVQSLPMPGPGVAIVTGDKFMTPSEVAA
ncbi:MAG: hypothetical protein KI788_15830 [Mameliella sp.]|nr:hypothetical protein [Mameliella sp.]